jgi:hypothetical protein
MIRDGDAGGWAIRVLKDAMGTGAVLDEKSGPLQCANDFFGFDDG